MLGNGVWIGMANTAVLLRPILQVLPVGLAACTVGVAGPAMPGTVARHIVTITHLAAAITTLGSA